jgi:hypothetical protein
LNSKCKLTILFHKFKNYSLIQFSINISLFLTDQEFQRHQNINPTNSYNINANNNTTNNANTSYNCNSWNWNALQMSRMSRTKLLLLKHAESCCLGSPSVVAEEGDVAERAKLPNLFRCFPVEAGPRSASGQRSQDRRKISSSKIGNGSSGAFGQTSEERTQVQVSISYYST